MGWREGEGLGRDSLGITAPIQAEVRNQRVGVGADAGPVYGGMSDNYKESARLKARARFANSSMQS